MPFLTLVWLTGPLSLLLLGAVPYIFFEWYHDRIDDEWLYLAVLFLLFSLFGRFLILRFFKGEQDKPVFERSGDHRTTKDEGNVLISAETYGDKNLNPIIFTHGWSLDSTAWTYQKKALQEKFKLLFWDLPGLGKSSRYPDGKYSLERMAVSLNAVVDSEREKPCILVGHSIGGMIIQQYCELYPDALGNKVAGIVLINTTYTNPLRTMIAGPLMSALEKPVFVPLMYLSILFAPIVRLMNFASYINGTAHIAARIMGFSSAATREQIDFVVRLNMKMSPSVVARGDLGMFQWAGSQVLPNVNIPVMILSGSDDILTLPRASKYLKLKFPDSSLEVVEKAGHMGLMEQNLTYSTRIAQFADFCFLQADTQDKDEVDANLINQSALSNAGAKYEAYYRKSMEPRN